MELVELLQDLNKGVKMNYVKGEAFHSIELARVDWLQDLNKEVNKLCVSQVV